MNNPKIEKLENKKSPIIALASYIRQHVSSSFNAVLPNRSSGLLIGIVFGVKQGLDSAFYEDLKNTGVLHVVAASGMNVTMLSEYLLFLFGLILHRKIALVMLVFCLAIYTLISGAEPSIIRATIMSSVAFTAQIFGRQNFSYLSLFFTAFIMLLISPFLIENPGFQLSFASTLSILSLKPFFDTLFKSKSLVSIVSDDLGTTLTSQLGTLPILLFHFSNYSLVSILVNLCVLWMIPFLMILGGLASLFSIIYLPLSIPFLYLSYPLLFSFEKIISAFSGVSTHITIENIPLPLVVGYYLMLLALSLHLRSKSAHQRRT